MISAIISMPNEDKTLGYYSWLLQNHRASAFWEQLETERTTRTITTTSCAKLSTIEDDLKMELIPGLLRKQTLQIRFCTLDAYSTAQPPTLSKPVYVCIHGKGRHSEGLGHHNGGRFMPHAWQRFQRMKTGRNLAAMALQ